MSKKASIIKTILGFSLPTWVNAVISFLTVPLITRMFSPEDLGKFNVFVTYGYVFCCIGLAGLNQGLMRFYGDAKENNSNGALYQLCTRLAVLITSAISILILIFHKQISFMIAGEDSLIIPLSMIIYMFSFVVLTITSSVYRMEKLIVAYGFLTVLMNLCAKVSYACGILFHNRFIGALLTFSASHFLLACIFGIKEARKVKEFPKVVSSISSSDLLKYSLPLMPVIFIAQINTALPKLVIKEMMDFSQVGLYAAAYSVVAIISLVQSGVNVYWAPFVYNNYRERPRLLAKGHLLATYCMTLFGLLIVLFQDVIYLIIGRNYRSSQEFFALLLFGPICYTISETTGVGINLSKRTYLNIITYGTAVATTFVACYLLIPRWQLVGAAVSVAVSALITMIVKTMIGERFFKVITNPLKSFFGPIFFLLVVSLNTFFFSIRGLRTTISVIGIVVLSFVYRNELSWVLELGKDLLTKKQTN